MNTDIVTRLREIAEPEIWVAFSKYEATAKEAAEEIERLRTMLAHGLTQGSTCEGCSICEELKAFHKELMRND